MLKTENVFRISFRRKIFVNFSLVAISAVVTTILILLYHFGVIRKSINSYFESTIGQNNLSNGFKIFILGIITFLISVVALKLIEIGIRMIEVAMKIYQIKRSIQSDVLYNKPEQDFINSLTQTMKGFAILEYKHRKKIKNDEVLRDDEIKQIIKNKYSADINSLENAANWSIFYLHGMKFVMYGTNEELIFNCQYIDVHNDKNNRLVYLQLNFSDRQFMTTHYQPENNVSHENFFQSENSNSNPETRNQDLIVNQGFIVSQVNEPMEISSK